MGQKIKSPERDFICKHTPISIREYRDKGYVVEYYKWKVSDSIIIDGIHVKLK